MKQVYMCADGETVEGPLRAEAVYEMLAQGKVAKNVSVCIEGSENWLPFEEITFRLMNLSDHLDSISELLETRESVEQEQALLATTSIGAAVGMGFAGSTGNLHTDMFGNILSGSGHIPVGKLDQAPMQQGTLHVDNFGHVYSGHSQIPVGHTEKMPTAAGDLHSDTLGNIYAGHGPFPVGHLEHPHDHEF